MRLAEFSKKQAAVVSVRKTKCKSLANRSVTAVQRQWQETSGPLWSGPDDDSSSKGEETCELAHIQDPEGFVN